MDKIKLTQKEFEEFYEIDKETLELTNKQTGNKEMPVDTSVLTESEEAQDKELEESLDWEPVLES